MQRGVLASLFIGLFQEWDCLRQPSRIAVKLAKPGHGCQGIGIAGVVAGFPKLERFLKKRQSQVPLPGLIVRLPQVLHGEKRMEMARTKLGLEQLERFFVERQGKVQLPGFIVKIGQIMHVFECYGVVGAELGLVDLEHVLAERLGEFHLPGFLVVPRKKHPTAYRCRMFGTKSAFQGLADFFLQGNCLLTLDALILVSDRQNLTQPNEENVIGGQDMLSLRKDILINLEGLGHLTNRVIGKPQHHPHKARPGIGFAESGFRETRDSFNAGRATATWNQARALSVVKVTSG